MTRFPLLLLLSLLFVQPAFSALEESLSVPPGCELIGLIPFASHSSAITGDAKRTIDALVPLLLQRGKEKLVRIEGHGAKGATRAEYITKSMYLAKEVQKYLMYRHNVQLDLYLGAMDDTIVPGDGQFVRIVLYPNNGRSTAGRCHFYLFRDRQHRTPGNGPVNPFGRPCPRRF